MSRISGTQDEWPNITTLDAGIKLVIDQIDRCQFPLMPEEQCLANGVIGARLRELQAGRATARKGLLCLGNVATPILMDAIGAPSWPSEYCGSLSHTVCHVAALIALTNLYKSVGVDIDDGRPLGAAVDDVATTEELALVQTIEQPGTSTPECLVFSIKEAIFKCQCTITKDVALEFLDLHLVPGPTIGSIGFRVETEDRTLLKTIANQMQIRLVVAHGLTAVCAILPK